MVITAKWTLDKYGQIFQNTIKGHSSLFLGVFQRAWHGFNEFLVGKRAYANFFKICLQIIYGNLNGKSHSKMRFVSVISNKL